MKQAAMEPMDCDLDSEEFAEAASPFILAAHKREHQSGVDLLIGVAKAAVADRHRKGPRRGPRLVGTTPPPVPSPASDQPAPGEQSEEQEAETAARERARRRLASKSGVGDS